MDNSMIIVSRRQLMGLLGVAAAAVPLRLARAQVGVPSRPAPLSDPPPHLRASCPLLSPLVAGSVLGPWSIEGMTPVFAGAVTIALRDPRSTRFFVDVCMRDRDPGAASAPAATDRYELFLANEGDGHRPTHEEHGRAAMALAEVIRGNEHAVQLQGMLTLRQRLQRYAAQVGKAYIPA